MFKPLYSSHNTVMLNAMKHPVPARKILRCALRRRHSRGWRFLALAVALAVSAPNASALQDGLREPYDAPALAGIAAWVNSQPLDLAQLKGKVVLVDFWAYSCVNCVRTLPYITQWDRKYRDKGLVVIGVHAPEFEFEKSVDNVKHAVAKWHISYPVALDNDQVTWNNFRNQYWPAHYLIDKRGKVVYTHFGEGQYDVTENNIRELLGIDGKVESDVSRNVTEIKQTPETYLGYGRMEHFASADKVRRDAGAQYHIAETLALHQWGLDGTWEIASERITAGEKAASLRLHFAAKKLFMVLGTKSGGPVHATITLNGKPPGAQAGKDAIGGKLTVDQHTLYELINQDKASEGVFEIKSADAGLEAYTFTFGE